MEDFLGLTIARSRSASTGAGTALGNARGESASTFAIAVSRLGDRFDLDSLITEDPLTCLAGAGFLISFSG